MALQLPYRVSHFELNALWACPDPFEGYTGTDSLSNKDVLVRFLSLNLGAPVRLQLALQEQLDRQKKLHHPNICRAVEVGQDHGRVYWASRVPEGEPLLHSLPNDSRRTANALQLSAQLAEVVQFAHAQGHVLAGLHSGCLYAQNHKGHWRLSVDECGLAFGLAQQELLYGTAWGQRLLEFHSPERRTGDAASKADDIYALALVVIQLITQQSPEQTKAQIVDLEVRLLELEIAPAAVDWLLLSLSPRPEDRPSQAHELRLALQHSLPKAEPSATARHTNPKKNNTTSPKAPAEKPKRRWWLFGLLPMLLLSGLGVWQFMRKFHEPEIHDCCAIPNKEQFKELSQQDSLLQTVRHEKLQRFAVNGLYGFRSASGTVLIPPQFQAALNENEGLIAVKSQQKWGFVDKVGREIIAPTYTEVGSFSEGKAPVSMAGRWGYINRQGKEVIPFRYSLAGMFRNGRARVQPIGQTQQAEIDSLGRLIP